ncbi:type III pantothenate kinase [Ruthenibacterium sp. CLA-JM-H11]|uniref:Type III pantothenate kinase n=1 Tax=Ruthenibacterium intestinale TaxID=3133163 RepID=A0ABV1GC03_9FIRM
MVLTVNVSNTSVLLGAYEEGRQAFFASLHTNLSKTSDEYAVQMQSVLALYGRTPAEITGVIFSCVVPSLLSCIRHALSHLYSGRIYTVGPGLKTGLAIRMDDPSQLGSELVCCAVEVLAAYPHPCVIVSFDTATTMIALDEKGTMRGGTILPGVRTGMDALSIRTAQLPQIDLAAPKCGVLGTNSTACMQAGAILGTASMLDGMLDRFAAVLQCQELFCVATGEIAPVILPHCNHQIHYHENLVLDGLYRLYRKNAK